MSCSNASEPRERDVNAVGDATAEALAKIQANREANSSELNDGNIGLGSFIIVLHKNLWDLFQVVL